MLDMDAPFLEGFSESFNIGSTRGVFRSAARHSPRSPLIIGPTNLINLMGGMGGSGGMMGDSGGFGNMTTMTGGMEGMGRRRSYGHGCFVNFDFGGNHVIVASGRIFVNGHGVSASQNNNLNPSGRCWSGSVFGSNSGNINGGIWVNGQRVDGVGETLPNTSIINGTTARGTNIQHWETNLGNGVTRFGPGIMIDQQNPSIRRTFNQPVGVDDNTISINGVIVSRHRSVRIFRRTPGRDMYMGNGSPFGYQNTPNFENGTLDVGNNLTHTRWRDNDYDASWTSNDGPAFHEGFPDLVANNNATTANTPFVNENTEERVHQFLQRHTEALATNDSSNLPNSECPICLESATDHECVQIKGIDGCKHVFSLNCLKTFLKTNPDNQKTCPLCRKEWLRENGMWEDDPRVAETMRGMSGMGRGGRGGDGRIPAEVQAYRDLVQVLPDIHRRNTRRPPPALYTPRATRAGRVV